MKIKFNLKDGRYFTQELPNDEGVISLLSKLIVKGKNNNATITTKTEVVRYEDVASVELIFDE